MIDFEQLVLDCEKRESRLTPWEQGFIQSCRERLDDGRELTGPMTEILERIWDKVTEKG